MENESKTLGDLIDEDIPFSLEIGKLPRWTRILFWGGIPMILFSVISVVSTVIFRSIELIEDGQYIRLFLAISIFGVGTTAFCLLMILAMVKSLRRRFVVTNEGIEYNNRIWSWDEIDSMSVSQSGYSSHLLIKDKNQKEVKISIAPEAEVTYRDLIEQTGFGKQKTAQTLKQ